MDRPDDRYRQRNTVERPAAACTTSDELAPSLVGRHVHGQ